VIAMGYTPVNELYDRIRKVVPRTYLVGDAHVPRKVMESLSEAVEVGLKI